MDFYQNNTGIIGDFFKKPLVLVAAILSLLTTVSGFALNIVNALSGTLSSSGIIGAILSNPDAEETFDSDFIPTMLIISSSITIALGLLSALSLFMLWFGSRSRTSGLNAGALIFKITALIRLIIGGLGTAGLMLLVLILLFLIFTPLAGLSIILIPLCFIAAALILLLCISRFIFACSVKKSLSGSRLKKGGAMFFGVMCFIAAFLSAFLTVSFVTSPDGFSALAIINLLFDIGESVALGVIAVTYSSYIKGFMRASGCDEGFPDYAEPTFSDEQIEPEEEDFSPYGEPQGYMPSDSAQTYVQAGAVFCKNCGQQINPDDYFCNNCGTRVN